MSRVILLASSNQNKKTATTKIYINRQCKHWQSLVYLVFGVYLFSVEWILYVFRNRNRWYNQMSHLNASRNRIFTTIYYCKHNLWIFHWNVFNKWIAFFLGVCALCNACATKVQTNKKKRFDSFVDEISSWRKAHVICFGSLFLLLILFYRTNKTIKKIIGIRLKIINWNNWMKKKEKEWKKIEQNKTKKKADWIKEEIVHLLCVQNIKATQ